MTVFSVLYLRKLLNIIYYWLDFKLTILASNIKFMHAKFVTDLPIDHFFKPWSKFSWIFLFFETLCHFVNIFVFRTKKFRQVKKITWLIFWCCRVIVWWWDRLEWIMVLEVFGPKSPQATLHHARFRTPLNSDDPRAT